MRSAIIFVIILNLRLAAADPSNPFNLSSRKVSLQRFAQCQRYNRNLQKRGLVLITDVKVRPIPGSKSLGLNSKFMIPQDIVNNIRVDVNVWKCDTSGNADRCELFLKDYKINNVCSIIGAKNQLWTVFTANTDMPARCPILKGNYSMTNVPISTDFMKYLPVEDALWKTELNGYDGNRHVACLEFNLLIAIQYKKRP